eukprot:COSAG01_NODE_67955_length_265_cov_1.126506_1_plen_20_part_01
MIPQLIEDLLLPPAVSRGSA